MDRTMIKVTQPDKECSHVVRAAWEVVSSLSLEVCKL